MKNLFSKSLVLLFLGLSVTSCSDDNEQQTQNTAKSIISYKINEETFNSDVIGHSTINSDELGKVYIVSGGFSDNSDNSISFEIGESKIGVNSTETFSIIFKGKTFEDSGNLSTNVITNNGEKIVGTFTGILSYEFDASDVIEIKEGKFEIFIN